MDSMGPPPGRPPVNLPKDPFLEGSTLNHPHAPYTVAPHTVKEEGWSAYWDSMRDLEIKSREATFRVYEAGSSSGGPTVACVHGGGYTALTWSLVADALKKSYRVVAFDMRGHGTTRAEDSDLSVSTLVEDCIAVLQELMAGTEGPTASVVVLGHSLGGSIAARACASKKIPGLGGLFVMDVVEGTAVASLDHMDAVLAARPESFASVRDAIVWSLDRRMTRNPAAAGVSVPDMLRQADDGRFVWRTNLGVSKPFWGGWYDGLSDVFLASPCAKVLMLAGTDRLDKSLTIGQMQGKFQLIVVNDTGHCIQEDAPHRVSEAVDNFCKHFRVGQPLPAFLKSR